MLIRILCSVLFCIPFYLFSQESSVEKLLANPAMKHASVSLSIINAADGSHVMEYNSEKSLTPASIMKLVTTAAALELLGADHTMKTSVGYSGSLNRHSGRLSGDIIIKGGGDPALGSDNFSGHYGDFIAQWIRDIKKAGISQIDGSILADDSYFDYLPVPAKWLWEDAGNYYGAGAYGLSVYDNTYEIHFRTSCGAPNPMITGIVPEECRIDLSNRLVAAGTADRGYVFAAPYSTSGWLAGTIPVNRDNFILKASITDPPLLVARIVDQKLKNEGIIISGIPTTARLQQRPFTEKVNVISETISPPLKDIIRVLNHKSINLYAEHLTKELGRVFKNSSSTSAGIEVTVEFLSGAGVNMNGVFIVDGSGLSPLDAVNSKEMTNLLFFMKKYGKHFPEYLDSFADAGKEGTLKYYFRDPIFDTRVKAKGGSMTGVRSFAGYIRTLSGKDLIFCMIVNHFSGPPENIIAGIEEIIKDVILKK